MRVQAATLVLAQARAAHDPLLDHGALGVRKAAVGQGDRGAQLDQGGSGRVPGAGHGGDLGCAAEQYHAGVRRRGRPAEPDVGFHAYAGPLQGPGKELRLDFR